MGVPGEGHCATRMREYRERALVGDGAILEGQGTRRLAIAETATWVFHGPAALPGMGIVAPLVCAPVCIHGRVSW